MMWPQEQALAQRSLQQLTTSLPPFPRQGLCWGSFWGVWGFCRHELPISLQGPAIITIFLCFKLQSFGIVWYHCESGTQTCILVTSLHLESNLWITTNWENFLKKHIWYILPQKVSWSFPLASGKFRPSYIHIPGLHLSWWSLLTSPGSVLAIPLHTRSGHTESHITSQWTSCSFSPLWLWTAAPSTWRAQLHVPLHHPTPAYPLLHKPFTFLGSFSNGQNLKSLFYVLLEVLCLLLSAWLSIP